MLRSLQSYLEHGMGTDTVTFFVGGMGQSYTEFQIEKYYEVYIGDGTFEATSHPVPRICQDLMTLRPCSGKRTGFMDTPPSRSLRESRDSRESLLLIETCHSQCCID